MIYYSSLILSIFILYFITSNLQNTTKARKIFFIFTCTFVILFQGYRSFTVGTDLASYIPSYSVIGTQINSFSNLSFLNYESGYVVYNKLLYTLGFDERSFLIITAMFIQIPIFYTMYKYSKKPLLSIFVYFAFSNFIMTFSGLRQSIAMSLCFYSYKFIKEKKILFYMVAIIIATLFHLSAIICLLLYPLYYIKLDTKKIIFVIVIIVGCLIFNNQIIQLANQIYYGEGREIATTNAYTMLILYCILLIISYLINSNDYDYIGLRNILTCLCIIYTIAPVSNTFTRLGYPLSLYLTIFIPEIVLKINIKPNNLIKDIICYVICISCFFYFLGGLDTLPFSFL